MPDPSPDKTRSRRVLVLIGAAVSGHEVRDRLAAELADAAEVRVISPAFTETAIEHTMGDVDDARDAAQERLDRTLSELESLEAPVAGEVGDADPRLAIEDALQTFDATEIIVITHPDEDAAWLEKKAFGEAREGFELQVTHLVVEGNHVEGVERAPAGREGSRAAEVEGPSRNMPRLGVADLFGIAVAVVGTVVLWVLAGTCDEAGSITHGQPERGEEGGLGCGIRLGMAGGATLVNLAHVVGLFLFQSVQYRGGFRDLFAYLSLFGTPVAIVVSLLAI